MRTSGTVNFRLKESTKEEKPIFLDFSYGRKNRFKYAVGYSVIAKYWTGSEVKNVVAVRNSNQINDLLRDLKSEILNFVSDCDAKQIILSNDILRAHLNKFTHKNQPVVVEEKTINLLNYIDTYIQGKEKKHRDGARSQTLKSYRQTLKQLKEFEFDSGYKVDYDFINKDFLTAFTNYMQNKKYRGNSNYSMNTIAKHVKNFRVFMNASFEDDMHNNLKFKKFSIETEVTKAIYLTLEEQEKMLKLDLSETPHYELARDIFIIGCEIGQRISDYKDLSKHEIVVHNDEEFIKIIQQKTRKTVFCKITPAIRYIMNIRYKGSFPPKIAEQKLNDYIKKVGQKAGINEIIKHTITRGNKIIESKIPKFELIMGHSARRSYATLKYKAKMPVHDIMLLTGHSDLKSFKLYIRNSDEDQVAQITSSDEFKKSSIKI